MHQLAGTEEIGHLCSQVRKKLVICIGDPTVAQLALNQLFVYRYWWYASEHARVAECFPFSRVLNPMFVGVPVSLTALGRPMNVDPLHTYSRPPRTMIGLILAGGMRDALQLLCHGAEWLQAPAERRR